MSCGSHTTRLGTSRANYYLCRRGGADPEERARPGGPAWRSTHRGLPGCQAGEVTQAPAVSIVAPTKMPACRVRLSQSCYVVTRFSNGLYSASLVVACNVLFSSIKPVPRVEVGRVGEGMLLLADIFIQGTHTHACTCRKLVYVRQCNPEGEGLSHPRQRVHAPQGGDWLQQVHAPHPSNCQVFPSSVNRSTATFHDTM